MLVFLLHKNSVMKNVNNIESLYLEECLKIRQEKLRRTLDLVENDRFANDNLKRISQLSLFYSSLQILIIKYSYGINKEVLKGDIDNVIDYFDRFWSGDKTKVFDGRDRLELNQYRLEPHIYLVWTLSIAVLLDVEETKFNKLVFKISEDGVKDKVLNFLSSYYSKNYNAKLMESYEKYFEIPRMYLRLKNIIDNNCKEECEKLIREYLKKDWYNSYKKFNGWYNSHLLSPEKLSFAGYWAFEIAAVVKLKGLDDSKFRDNEYYPKDILS